MATYSPYLSASAGDPGGHGTDRVAADDERIIQKLGNHTGLRVARRDFRTARAVMGHQIKMTIEIDVV